MCHLIWLVRQTKALCLQYGAHISTTIPCAPDIVHPPFQGPPKIESNWPSGGGVFVLKNKLSFRFPHVPGCAQKHPMAIGRLFPSILRKFKIDNWSAGNTFTNGAILRFLRLHTEIEYRDIAQPVTTLLKKCSFYFLRVPALCACTWSHVTHSKESRGIFGGILDAGAILPCHILQSEYKNAMVRHTDGE